MQLLSSGILSTQLSIRGVKSDAKWKSQPARESGGYGGTGCRALSEDAPIGWPQRKLHLQYRRCT